MSDNKKKADEVKGTMTFINEELGDYKKDAELQVYYLPGPQEVLSDECYRVSVAYYLLFNSGICR